MITMQQLLFLHKSLRCLRVSFRAKTQQLLFLLLLISIISMGPTASPTNSQRANTSINKQNHPSLPYFENSPVPTLLLPGAMCIMSTGSLPCCENSPVPTTAVVIHIVNLSSRGGQVCIAVFDSDENFRIEKPLKDKILIRSAHDGDTLTVSLQLPEGMYGISVLDDSNSDSRMNYGFAGIPLEGFGFSGYRQKRLKRPRFSDFSFKHSSNTQVEIRMTYLY